MRISSLTALAAALALLGSDCAARPAADGGPILARTAAGKALGRLAQVSDFPLYELEYAAEYDLEELRLSAVAGASRASPDRARESFACTCVSASLESGHRVFGRNFDWDAHPALVLRTRPKAGYSSICLVDIAYLGYEGSRSPMDDPSGLDGAWLIPFDGMNEKGLAVGMMAVERMDGPSGAGRPRVGSLGIIRILLDRAATVAEALDLMEGYEIDEEGGPPLHYMIADLSGDGAVVEFLGGKRRVFRDGRAWMVSTNFLLSRVPVESRDSACWRYAKASSALRDLGGILADESSLLGLLSGVSQATTRWSAAYDLSEGSLALALGRDYSKVYRWRL
jgi:hypothetical protein